MDLKDKLNLVWKFLFLAVFTYAVISMTCCMKSCETSCSKESSEVAPCGWKGLAKKPCSSGTDTTKTK